MTEFKKNCKIGPQNGQNLVKGKIRNVEFLFILAYNKLKKQMWTMFKNVVVVVDISYLPVNVLTSMAIEVC